MKTFLASLLFVATIVPLAPATSAVDACGIECIVDLHPCLYSSLATVCWEVTPDCVSVAASVYSQQVYVYRYVPGQSFATKPIDVGPVHVSSVTVSTDPVTVGPYSFWTPGRNVSNTFCQSQLLA